MLRERERERSTTRINFHFLNETCKTTIAWWIVHANRKRFAYFYFTLLHLFHVAQRAKVSARAKITTVESYIHRAHWILHTATVSHFRIIWREKLLSCSFFLPHGFTQNTLGTVKPQGQVCVGKSNKIRLFICKRVVRARDSVCAMSSKYSSRGERDINEVRTSWMTYTSGP